VPPKSEAQRRLMWAARDNPKLAKRKGISSKVAREFTDADKGGKLPERKQPTPQKGRKK